MIVLMSVTLSKPETRDPIALTARYRICLGHFQVGSYRYRFPSNLVSCGSFVHRDGPDRSGAAEHVPRILARRKPQGP